MLLKKKISLPLMKKINYNSAEDARSYCFYLLSLKDYCEKQLTDKMKEKGYCEDAVSETIAYLKERNYVNDEDFARSFTQNAVNNRKKGRAYIKSALFRYGIKEHIIEQVIEECYHSGEIYSLAQNKINSLKKNGVVERKDIEKVKAFLFRRGFSFDEINKAIERADYEKN